MARLKIAIYSVWVRAFHVLVGAVPAAIPNSNDRGRLMLGGEIYNKTLFIVIIIRSFNPAVLHVLKFPGVPGPCS